MLTRDDALALCDTVLARAKAAGADDAIVSVESTVASHARFADSRLTTSGRSEDLTITVTVWVGRRRGAVVPSSGWRARPCRSRASRPCIASTSRPWAR